MISRDEYLAVPDKGFWAAGLVLATGGNVAMGAIVMFDAFGDQENACSVLGYARNTW